MECITSPLHNLGKLDPSLSETQVGSRGIYISQCGIAWFSGLWFSGLHHKLPRSHQAADDTQIWGNEYILWGSEWSGACKFRHCVNHCDHTLCKRPHNITGRKRRTRFTVFTSFSHPLILSKNQFVTERASKNPRAWSYVLTHRGGCIIPGTTVSLTRHQSIWNWLWDRITMTERRLMPNFFKQ